MELREVDRGSTPGSWGAYSYRVLPAPRVKGLIFFPLIAERKCEYYCVLFGFTAIGSFFF
jgi:hypothetical protein